MRIIIHDVIVSKNGRRIDNSFEVDPALRQYFLDYNFYAEYETDISTVPLSILNIPALSTLLHFAVAVGADIEIDLGVLLFNINGGVQPAVFKLQQGGDCFHHCRRPG